LFGLCTTPQILNFVRKFIYPIFFILKLSLENENTKTRLKVKNNKHVVTGTSYYQYRVHSMSHMRAAACGVVGECEQVSKNKKCCTVVAAYSVHWL
jgi:hypothetical protein